ncbi:lytic transglycosylase domain-containing protein [Gallicola sp. Sow4_E12]|uniref:lytic transglycosylase domain-containing protein n=1 Tax=Gallicola sp. Sow4_E12 TaxID=3438785 RepID=UPI003F9175FA
MKFLKNLILGLLAILIIIFIISFGIVSYGTITRPVEYTEYINKYSEEYDVDPMLVYSVIKVESNYNPDAHSPMNAHGLMQILPETGSWIAERLKIDYSEEMLKDPETSIQMGTYYLSYLVHHFKDRDLAIAAYNGGLGNVEKWLADENLSKDGESLDEIPFVETRNYVVRVNDNYRIYDLFYGDEKNLEDKEHLKPSTLFKNYLSVLKRIKNDF